VCPHSTVCEAQALSSGEPVEQLQIFQVAGRFDSTRFSKEDSNTHRCQVPNFASEIPGPKLIIKKYGKVNVWCSRTPMFEPSAACFCAWSVCRGFECSPRGAKAGWGCCLARPCIVKCGQFMAVAKQELMKSAISGFGQLPADQRVEASCCLELDGTLRFCAGFLFVNVWHVWLYPASFGYNFK